MGERAGGLPGRSVRRGGAEPGQPPGALRGHTVWLGGWGPWERPLGELSQAAAGQPVGTWL